MFSSEEIQEILFLNFHCFIARVDDKTLYEQDNSTFGTYYRELQIKLFDTQELPNYLLIQHDGNMTIRKKAFESVLDFKTWLDLDE